MSRRKKWNEAIDNFFKESAKHLKVPEYRLRGISDSDDIWYTCSCSVKFKLERPLHHAELSCPLCKQVVRAFTSSRG